MTDPTPGSLTPPTYYPTLVPGDLSKNDGLWIPSCSLCGSLVLNLSAHDRWHLGVSQLSTGKIADTF